MSRDQGLRAREILLQHIDECIKRRAEHVHGDGDEHPGLPYTPQHSDALSIILQKNAQEGGVISAADLRDLALELLFAGHETSASAACSTIRLLASHGHVTEKAHAELCSYGLEDGGELTYDVIGKLTYISNVVKEILRLLPPIGGGFRKALKTFELNVSMWHSAL